MGFQSVSTISTITNTATLDISLDGGPLTTFSYDHAAGTVSVPARPGDVTTNPADFAVIQASVYIWISAIIDSLHASPGPLGPYTVKYRKTGNKVICNGDLGPLVDYEAEWQASTGIITLKARPAFALDFAEFVEFIDLHQRLLDMIGAW